MRPAPPRNCFVIQPFDDGEFDKRYEDVIEPAIRDADLQPYRVDRDLSAVILIDNVEAGIAESPICLADISTDNPNVWFELGFAIALKKPVVLICSTKREKFPFDVQHRAIESYTSDSIRDFAVLRRKITARLRSLRSAPAEAWWPQAAPLTDDEAWVLRAVAHNLESLNHEASAEQIGRGLAETLSVEAILDRLVSKRLVDVRSAPAYVKGAVVYSATRSGLDWVAEHTGTPAPPTDPEDGPF